MGQQFKQGPDWSAEVIDSEGKHRPDWSPKLMAALPRALPVRIKDWGIGDGWGEGVRALASRAPDAGKLVSVAFFRSR